MYKRIVVKIGTRVLSNSDGETDELVLHKIVEQLVAVKRKGVEVTLVTSGAVGIGRKLLKDARVPEDATSKQVCAAVGQSKLMGEYMHLFGAYDILCAQVLVTKEDFRDRNHYQNMRKCFLGLLVDGIVPIVNENDVIASSDVAFTDNDELAGLVAAQIEADAVIILTSVEGFIDGNPKDPEARVIPELSVEEITELQQSVSREKTAVGRGGMVTKLSIARRLALSGIAVHMANGKRDDVLQEILSGKKVGTFIAPARKLNGVKRRLAYAEGLAAGTIIVNEQASRLLIGQSRAMSILPVGITQIRNDFRKGDIVEIEDARGKRIGFGIAASDSASIQSSIGKKGARPAVHYNYLLIE